jgi:aspartate/methionine/tyrosine aminotransferase
MKDVRRMSKNGNVRIAERVKQVSSEPFRLALGLPRDVIRLTGGEPDFETPAFVREAAKMAIDKGFTHYTPSTGYDELRKAIAEKLHRENHITYDYGTEVVITPGSSSGVFLSLLALVNPRDEVLVPDPIWFHYVTLIRLCGGSPVAVPVTLGQNAGIDAEEARRRITSRTRVLILNSPCNPTGMVLSRENILALGEVAEEHNLTIVSDEIYERIIYEGNVHTSPASLPALRHRTVTSNGFSKAYAMTGWRVGHVAGPSEIIEKVTALSGYTLVCPGSVSQKAAYAAVTDPRMAGCIKGMVDRFARRRKLVLDALNDLRGARAYPPQGTFYAWVDINETRIPTEQFAYKLLESERVGVLPGSLFGPRGEGHIRISFATGEDQLKEGLERLRRFVLSATLH